MHYSIRIFIILTFVFFNLLLLGLTVGAASLFAEENTSFDCPKGPMNMQRLIDTALTNNPETQAAWWNAQRAMAAVGRAKSAYYPVINMNGRVDHSYDFKFTNGPDVNATVLSANLVMDFLLFDSGERLETVKMFIMALYAAGWESEWTIQKVIAQVLENAYLTIYAQDTLDALRLSQNDAKKMLIAAENLREVGLSPISDVYSSKAALAQIDIEVAEQRSHLEIQRAKLAATLGLEADTFVEVERLDALNMPERDLNALIDLAKATRQDLMAKRAKLAEALAHKKKVYTSYGPSLSLFGRGGADHAIRDRASAGHYEVALNLNVPLFTGFEATFKNRMAYADVKLSENELLQLELTIALEVLTESSKVESSREMLRYAKINLENAQAAYEAALEKYRAGKERFAELSIALRQIVSARVRYSEINARYLVSVANLAFATGTLNQF